MEWTEAVDVRRAIRQWSSLATAIVDAGVQVEAMRNVSRSGAMTFTRDTAVGFLNRASQGSIPALVARPHSAHGGPMEFHAVPIAIPDEANVIVGQSHFIKTIVDLHETLALSSPSLRFGAAFCEASGPRLVRRSGNDDELVTAAVDAALAIGAGHSFVVFLRDGYPVNVLNAIKAVPEVCRIVCATANPLEVLVASTERGRGIVGVVDGEPPLGVESERDVVARLDLLTEIGYRV